MHPLRWLVILLSIAAIFAGVGLLYQRHVADALRAELVLLHDQQRQLARARAENKRLASEQPSAEELKRVQAEHAAVMRLRAEIDLLRTRADEKARGLQR